METLPFTDYVSKYKEMSRTGLAFHRKHQTLVDLENERPKSMATIHEAIKDATSALENRIHDMSLEFHGSRRPEGDLRTLIPHIRNIMNVFQVTYIHASYQVEEIIQMAADPTEVFHADRYDLEFLKDFQRRLIDFVPERFEPLINDFRKIYSYVEKYCVSFFDGLKDPDLETTYHYHLKQKEFKEAIDMHLGNISNMATAYRDKSGLNIKHFGLKTNELARRCDCGDLPFLLVFPQAIQNMLMACQAIFRWVKEDEGYVDMIKHDIERTKAKKVEAVRQLKRNKDELALGERQLRNTKKDIEVLEHELSTLKPREKQVNKEINFLKKEIRFREIDIELKQQKRTELEKEAQTKGVDYSKEFDKIASEIVDLRYAIPEVQKQIDVINTRASFLTKKKHDLAKKRKEVIELQKKNDTQKTCLVLEEKGLKRLEKCLIRLKDIYHRKTSSEITKKIFYNMPVEPRNARHLPKKGNRVIKKDALGKASKVVADKIEKNWKDLYRELPFCPPRGEKTVDKDLSNILLDKYRTNEATMAKESLEQWRRQHTRANLHELKCTLSKMDRHDIIEDIDETLKKKSKVAPTRNKRRWRRVLAKNQAVSKLLDLKPPRQSRIARMMSAHNRELQELREAEAEEKRKERNMRERKKEKQNQKQSRVPALPKILVHS